MLGLNGDGQGSGGYSGAMGGSTSTSAGSDQVLLQQEIDKSTNVLGDKVARIKEISMAIGDQVRSSNALLDDMEGDMGGVAGLLKGTMKRLEKLVESGGDRCFCYLIAFFIFVMLLLYWLATSSSPKQ